MEDDGEYLSDRSRFETYCWLTAGVAFAILALPQVHLFVLQTLAPSPFWNQFSAGLPYTLGFYAALAVIAGLLNGSQLIDHQRSSKSLFHVSCEVATELRESVRAIVRMASKKRLLQIWVPALLVAVILRLPYLADNLRYDEAYTVNQYVDQPFVYLFHYSDPNNHVLHTLWVKLSVICFGWQEWAIRLPAFLAGVLTIPVIAIWSSRLNGGFAWIATWLIAVWPYHIFYSVNARGYTLQTLLILIAISLLHTRFKKQQPIGYLVPTILALAMFVLPTTVFALVGVVIYIAIWKLRHPSLLNRWTSIFFPAAYLVLATGLLYSPVVAASNGPAAILANRFVEPTSFAGFTLSLPDHVRDTMYAMGADLHRAFRFFCWLTLAFLVIQGLTSKDNAQRELLSLVACLLLGAMVVLVLQRRVPFERTWLYLLPFLVMAASAVASMDAKSRLGVFWQGTLREAFLISWLVLIAIQGYLMLVQSPIHNYAETGLFKDAKAVADFLCKSGIKRAQIDMSVPEGAPLDYYLRRCQDQASKLNNDDSKVIVVDRVVRDPEALTSKRVELVKRIGTAEVYRVIQQD